jgi:hypothetical protein
MLIQCPDCGTKMRPKQPATTPEGAKVSCKCRCGTAVRFTMPGKPKFDPRQHRTMNTDLWSSILSNMGTR